MCAWARPKARALQRCLLSAETLCGGCAQRLMATAKAHPDFAPLVEGVCPDPEPLKQPLAQQLRSLTNAKQWLMALHLCCNYLAAKVVDKVLFPLQDDMSSHCPGHACLPACMRL